MAIYAVITAAGQGTRMKSDINKQFIEIGGVPVLARTIKAFQDCEYIHSIVLVVNEKEISYCQKNIIDKYSFSKVKKIVPGGKERQQSVYRGLCEIDSDCEIVLIHDGARPFIKNREIINCINAARQNDACGVGVRSKDTIKVSDEDNFVKATPDRNTLWSIQTPQCFTYNVIMQAHEKAIADGYIGTDDMVLVERLGVRVKIVEGDYSNIKITTPEDILIGERFLDSK